MNNLDKSSDLDKKIKEINQALEMHKENYKRAFEKVNK